MARREHDLKILLVEDDEVDAEGVRRALAREGVAHEIRVARDGIDALRILRGSASRRGIEQPYIVLLDLNLPRMNGLELLEEIRSDPGLAESIIFVLTTSDAERDRAAAYRRQVAGYMLKSKVGEECARLTGLLHRYRRLVEFPPEA